MTMDELVRAAAKGDQEAFAQLVRQYEDQVYHLALRMCSDPEDARDVAQEAFLSAWRGLPSFRREAEFATWLHRLTANAAIDHLRRTKRQRGNVSLDDEQLRLDAVDDGPGPQRTAEGRELRDAVADGLRKLPDEHRAVLVLREMRGLSYQEISETLSLDLGTVKSRISRARAALRKILLASGNLSGYLPSNGLDTKGKEGR